MTPPRPEPQYTVNVMRKFDEDTEPIQYFGNLFITNALRDSLIHMVLAEEIAGNHGLMLHPMARYLEQGGVPRDLDFQRVMESSPSA